MAVIERYDVPVPTRLIVGTEPVHDVLCAMRGWTAIGGRVMQIELARQGGPQSLVVVAGDRITDKEVTWLLLYQGGYSTLV